MPLTQRGLRLEIKTPLGPDVLLLRSFTITEQLGRPFLMSLDLLSENHQVTFADVVGQNVTVRLNTPSGNPRHFNGVISRFRQVEGHSAFAPYHAQVMPWLWFLTRTADCRIFQNMTVPEILKGVFRDHGLTDLDDRLTGTYRKREHCVQYRGTDFRFVSRLMEQEGIDYFFTHQDGRHALPTIPPPAVQPTLAVGGWQRICGPASGSGPQSYAAICLSAHSGAGFSW
jgi:type VI secretion system secreted protein VgrG